ncbi:hypothetical protein A3715_14705 [Oleiphilus sp. HI0009]|nr:hypothetical protein A3715_14705 [Oleiphilus sp. HI0009]
MLHTINVLNSTFASIARSWRGTSSTKEHYQPEKPIILFDREGDPECRLVRETLTALNLDVTIMPCPIGGENIKQLRRDSGTDQVPVLYDTNVEESRKGASDIIQYLFKQYKGVDAPSRTQITPQQLRRSKLSSLLRLNAGIKAKPSKSAQQPLTLYSFESSPFSRIVRERLCELELPYQLINLGKQQKADMGPAKFRFHRGEYRPVPESKREAFLEKWGNVQVPFLVDPNTDKNLFESAKIVDYLNQQYAK